MYCSVLQCVLQYVAHPIQGLDKGVHWQQAVAAPDTFALHKCVTMHVGTIFSYSLAYLLACVRHSTLSSLTRE